MPKSKTSLDEILYDIRRIAESREKLTEEKIAAIYQDLMDNLEKFVGQQYKKYADSDGRLYISYLDAQRKRAKFLQEIVDNVEGLSLDLKEEMETLIDITYKECYQGMSKALLEADGAGLLEAVSKDIAANPNVLKQSLKNNISKLTLTPMMEKFRNEITYKIQQELTIGLMQGDRYEQMARRIEQQIDVSYNRAKLIARTEAHRNVETGFMDCAEHIQEGLGGSDLIYAATWRTMKDERVRPNRRIKTKHGWKIVKGKGANHQKMEGVTVKAGEMFDLGDGVKAKAPSESGVAAHDCNCRCFLEYNLMTVAEFAKATGQTEEQVRKKYKIEDTRENEPAVKEKDLTESEKSDKIVLPKSLENFDEHQQKWVDSHFLMRKRDKEVLQEGIQSVIDSNAYSMRVSAKNLQGIIDNGFLNQFETGTSGGTLSSHTRKTASHRLFGDDTDNMKDSEFEKYGYLGSTDFAVDAKTSATGQYGSTIIHFNKDKLKDRVTYTVDDSLGNAMYGEVAGGKIGKECSISGVPLYNTSDLLEYFKESDWNEIDNADELAQVIGCRYWELQYHGDLTMDDVESICFTRYDKPTEDVLKQLKDLGIKVYKLAGGKLNEM